MPEFDYNAALAEPEPSPPAGDWCPDFSLGELRTVAEFLIPNAMGQHRTILIKRNGYDRYTWRLRYQDNPAIADNDYTYTENYFHTAAAALRSARRFMRQLAQ